MTTPHQLAYHENELKRLQAALASLIPLGIKWRQIKCGKKCRCQQGLLHGPYPYLRIKRDGKWVHHYLGRDWEPPAGICKPSQYRRLMRQYRERLKEVERLRDQLARAS
jgi:hypothetical protein